MGALGWIISLGSGAGLAGYLAMLFFAPQAAVAVERVALDLLSRIMSTRLGVGALVGALAFIAGDFYGDHSGAARVQAEWDAAEHAAVLAGREAREQAEREIAPLAEASPDAAPPAPAQFHIPFLKEPKDHACPEPLRAPRPRADDEQLRHDPHNRDHR
jgi:hypothetical protein